MNQTMSHIICSRQSRYFHLIPCEHLARLKYESMPHFVLIFQMLINLFQVHFRHPRICIYYRQHHILWINFVWFHKILLYVLCTPTHISSFSLLLILPHFMSCVTHQLEMIFVILYQFLSLEIRFRFMFLHS